MTEIDTTYFKVCKKCERVMEYQEPSTWAKPHSWKCRACIRALSLYNHELMEDLYV